MTSGYSPCHGWVLPATRENWTALNLTLSNEDAAALIECLEMTDLNKQELNEQIRKDEELFGSILDALDENPRDHPHAHADRWF